MSAANITKALVALVRGLAERKERLAAGLFVAEGPKLVADLLSSRLRVAHLYATAEGLTQLGDPAAAADQVLVVSETELARLSHLRSPQGVLALVELPREDWRAFDARASRSLLLDDVQDPGNVGTLVRIADWFGLDAIFASPQTADFFQPKVVQASMGSLARVRLFRVPLPEALAQLDPGLPRLGAVLDGDDLYQVDLPRHGLLLIGNEARGLAPALQAGLSHRLRIPHFPASHPRGPGAPDSLNAAVAAAVLCAEWRRQVATATKPAGV